jgi:hypothetical protein
MGDFGSSFVRTVVPVVAGFLLTLLVNLGVDLDEESSLALTTFLTGLFTSLYYLVFRFLEVKFSSQWGWLLGLAKEPTYDKPA